MILGIINTLNTLIAAGVLYLAYAAGSTPY